MAYADDFYDYNDYGMGDDNSGILLLLTMSERKWKMSTHGDAIRIFTDAGQEYMSDKFVSSLTDGDYYEGFTEFCRSLRGVYHTGNRMENRMMWRICRTTLYPQAFCFLCHWQVVCSCIDRISGDAMSDENSSYET